MTPWVRTLRARGSDGRGLWLILLTGAAGPLGIERAGVRSAWLRQRGTAVHGPGALRSCHEPHSYQQMLLRQHAPGRLPPCRHARAHAGSSEPKARHARAGNCCASSSQSAAAAGQLPRQALPACRAPGPLPHIPSAVHLNYVSMRPLRPSTRRAPGEAFDKSARLLGLPADPSGGAALEAFAAGGDSGRFAFSLPLRGRPDCNFSYAGLKTAVRLAVEAEAPGPPSDGNRQARGAASAAWAQLQPRSGCTSRCSALPSGAGASGRSLSLPAASMGGRACSGGCCGQVAPGPAGQCPPRIHAGDPCDGRHSFTACGGRPGRSTATEAASLSPAAHTHVSSSLGSAPRADWGMRGGAGACGHRSLVPARGGRAPGGARAPRGRLGGRGAPAPAPPGRLWRRGRQCGRARAFAGAPATRGAPGHAWIP